MTRLSHVSFAHPIPMVGSHRREASFASPAWTIERSDTGDFHIVGDGLDFWTDGYVSWKTAETTAGSSDGRAADGSGPATFADDGSRPSPPTKKGKR